MDVPPPYEASSSSSQRVPAPPSTAGAQSNEAAAPPVYEPWSYAEQYARVREAARRRGENVGDGSVPSWHGPPVYNVILRSNTRQGSVMTVHIAPPQSDEQQAQSLAEKKRSEKKQTLEHPAVWQAQTSLGHDTMRTIRHAAVAAELRRISPFSDTSELAVAIADVSVSARAGHGQGGGLFSRMTSPSRGAASSSRDGSIPTAMKLLSPRNKTLSCVQNEPAGSTDCAEMTLDDGRRYTWKQSGDRTRLELLDAIYGTPMAILHVGTTPMRLELTGFPWARMPSDELECDYDGCTLRPLFGFNFRCRDCSERGDDTYDICEAHLPDVCKPPTIHAGHRFIRQPRPWTPHDDKVRETPLLSIADLELERQAQEVVLASLASVLFFAPVLQ